MSHNGGTFADLCLSGEVDAEEIDDFVDAWHEGDTGQSLHDFLGLTRDEYGRWVEEPASLVAILDARRRAGRIGSAS